MKKLVFGLIALVFLIFSAGSSAYAEKAYLGLGMAYHAEEFNADMGYDNSYGFNLFAGYDVNEKISLELAMDKIQEFGTNNPVSEKDIDLRGYSLNMKFYPGAEKEKVNGYLLLGLGWMKAEASDNSIKKTDSGEVADLWGKLGVGSDFVVTDKIAFYVEIDYAQGFRDLNPIDFYSGKIGFRIYP